MAQSDTNRVSLAYKEETTFGVVPSGNPTFSAIRMTGESLRQETQTTVSQEIRSDRQITDLVRNGLSAAGDVNFEFSYAAFDELLAIALLAGAGAASAAWSSVVTISGTDLEAINSDNSFNSSAEDLSTLARYQWVRVTGFSNAANNGLFKITSAPTANKIIVQGSTTLVDENGVTGEIEMGAQIVNGTQFRSLTIEREYTDLSNTFEQVLGLAIDQWSMSIASDQLITGSFGFIGSLAQSASATAGDGSNDESNNANPIMNGIDNVLFVLEGTNVQDITNMTLQLQNNLRQRLQVGTLGAISVGQGAINCSGTLQAYFESSTLFDKYLNFTATSLAIAFQDADGNQYVIDFPRVKLGGGQRVAGGQNQDVIADLQWTAFRNSDESVTARIARFAV